MIDVACRWRFLANSAACILLVARIVARIGEPLPNLTSTGQNLAPGAVVRVMPSPADSRRSSAVINMVVVAVVVEAAPIHHTSCGDKPWATVAGCDDRQCGLVLARHSGRWCRWWSFPATPTNTDPPISCIPVSVFLLGAKPGVIAIQLYSTRCRSLVKHLPLNAGWGPPFVTNPKSVF